MTAPQTPKKRVPPTTTSEPTLEPVEEHLTYDNKPVEPVEHGESEQVVESEQSVEPVTTPTQVKKQRRIQVTLRDFNGAVTVSSSTAPLKKSKVTIAPDVVTTERKPRKINTDLPRGTIRGLFIGSAR